MFAVAVAAAVAAVVAAVVAVVVNHCDNVVCLPFKLQQQRSCEAYDHCG